MKEEEEDAVARKTTCRHASGMQNGSWIRSDGLLCIRLSSEVSTVHVARVCRHWLVRPGDWWGQGNDKEPKNNFPSSRAHLHSLSFISRNCLRFVCL